MFDCSSDVLTCGPMSKEKALDVVLLISRFITSCDAEQIRIASDKCNHLHISVLLSLGEMMMMSVIVLAL